MTPNRIDAHHPRPRALITGASAGMGAAFARRLAAVGLALTMVGAAVTHARRHEIPALAAPVILGVLALVVAWARFGPYAL